MTTQWKRITRFARLDTLPMLARRIFGLSMWQEADYFPALSHQQRQHLQSMAHKIRPAAQSNPAIFIHGVLPRSGTNLLSDILALHPSTQQNPGALWEFPLLMNHRAACAMEAEFHFAHPHNAEVMVPYSLLTAAAQGWLASLQAQAPTQRMLFKSPHMQGIGLFDAVFPKDKLFLLLRDGRDVAASSLASFGKHKIFSKRLPGLAQEWAQATEAALLAAEHIGPRAMLLRFEDLANADRSLIEMILHHAMLDPALYDWKAWEHLPVRGTSQTAIQNSPHWQPEPRAQDFNPIGRWRSWPQARKQKFNAIAGTALIAAGYEAEP
jgi:protein-tyrosine sulfotransferase